MTNTAEVTPVPGAPALLLSAFDLADVGYVVEEFFVYRRGLQLRPGERAGSRWPLGRNTLGARPISPPASWR